MIQARNQPFPLTFAKNLQIRDIFLYVFPSGGSALMHYGPENPPDCPSGCSVVCVEAGGKAETLNGLCERRDFQLWHPFPLWKASKHLLIERGHYGENPSVLWDQRDVRPRIQQKQTELNRSSEKRHTRVCDHEHRCGWSDHQTHQDQLVPLEFPAPEGLRAVPAHQSLLAVNFIFCLPCRQTLQKSNTFLWFFTFFTHPVASLIAKKQKCLPFCQACNSGWDSRRGFSEFNQFGLMSLIGTFFCYSTRTDVRNAGDPVNIRGRPTLHFLPSTVSSLNSSPIWKLISVVRTVVEVLM